MATLDELQKLRDELIKHRFSGRRSWQYDGEGVTYASDAEMRTALADLDRQIATARGSGTVSVVRISSSKGV